MPSWDSHSTQLQHEHAVILLHLQRAVHASAVPRSVADKRAARTPTASTEESCRQHLNAQAARVEAVDVVATV